MPRHWSSGTRRSACRVTPPIRDRNRRARRPRESDGPVPPEPPLRKGGSIRRNSTRLSLPPLRRGGSAGSARRRGGQRMGYLGRKAWVLAGVAVLGFGAVLVAVRVRAHSDPAELAAETRLALRDRNWDRAEDLLVRLAQRRPPTADDVVLRAEL